MIKFELVNNAPIGDCIIKPMRQTELSAGYDFYMPYDVTIQPNEMALVPTWIKCKLPRGYYLAMHMRSSIGVKRHIMLANVTGIIDADYYGNEDNDGNIMLPLYNYGNHTVRLQRGERVAQGIICHHFVTDDDDCRVKRTGGIGSTNG